MKGYREIDIYKAKYWEDVLYCPYSKQNRISHYLKLYYKVYYSLKACADACSKHGECKSFKYRPTGIGKGRNCYMYRVMCDKNLKGAPFINTISTNGYRLFVKN